MVTNIMEERFQIHFSFCYLKFSSHFRNYPKIEQAEEILNYRKIFHCFCSTTLKRFGKLTSEFLVSIHLFDFCFSTELNSKSKELVHKARKTLPTLSRIEFGLHPSKRIWKVSDSWRVCKIKKKKKNFEGENYENANFCLVSFFCLSLMSLVVGGMNWLSPTPKNRNLVELYRKQHSSSLHAVLRYLGNLNVDDEFRVRRLVLLLPNCIWFVRFCRRLNRE